MNALPLHEVWDRLLPPERRWLGFIVLLSLLAHLACFFLFKVDNPMVVGVPRRPLQVTMLMPRPGVPGDASTGALVWLDWRDPSVIALPRSPLPELPPPRPASWPKTLPGNSNAVREFHENALKQDIAPLSQQVAEGIQTLKPEPMDVQIETPPPLSGTSVQISGALADRAIRKKTELPQPSVDRDLKVTVLGLSVDAEGVVENVLVENSCEDSAVDQLAVHELQNWRFAPASGPSLQWGKAFIYWHFKEKPVATGQATP